jgi:hypothetical protein
VGCRAHWSVRSAADCGKERHTAASRCVRGSTPVRGVRAACARAQALTACVRSLERRTASGACGPTVYRRTYLGRESPPSWRCASRATGACGWSGAAGSRAACCTSAPRPRLRSSTVRPTRDSRHCGLIRRSPTVFQPPTANHKHESKHAPIPDLYEPYLPDGLRPLPHTAAVLRRYCGGAHRHRVLPPARTRPHVAQTRPPPAQALTVHGNGPRTAGS